MHRLHHTSNDHVTSCEVHFWHTPWDFDKSPQRLTRCERYATKYSRTPAFRWNKRWKILPPTNDKRMLAKYLATSNFTCHNLQLWLAINVFFPTAVPGTHSSLESRTSSASGPTPGGITGIRGQDGRSGAQSQRGFGYDSQFIQAAHAHYPTDRCALHIFVSCWNSATPPLCKHAPHVVRTSKQYKVAPHSQLLRITEEITLENETESNLEKFKRWPSRQTEVPHQLLSAFQQSSPYHQNPWNFKHVEISWGMVELVSFFLHKFHIWRVSISSER